MSSKNGAQVIIQPGEFFPKRSKRRRNYIIDFLIDYQKLADVRNLNRALLEFAQKVYSHPEQAPELCEKYWRELEIFYKFDISRWDDSPSFPGGIGYFYYKELREGKEIAVRNRKALKNISSNFDYLSIPCVVLKPQVDYGVVEIKDGTHYLHFEPIQNMRVHILGTPETEVDQLPGLKEIVFNEDYQYQMIDPDSLDRLK